VRRLFENYKLKIEGKPQNHQQEVSEDADFTDKKKYHNRSNPQNSCSAGGYPLGNPSGKEHAEHITTTSYLTA